MLDLRAIGVFHQPHLLIVGHRDISPGLDAGDKARVHPVAKFRDAVGVTGEMRRPEEAHQFRPLRSPRRCSLFDAPAELGLEHLDGLFHQRGDFGINAGMAKVRTEGDPRRARPARQQAGIIGRRRL